jgi:hypothetical protein
MSRQIHFSVNAPFIYFERKYIRFTLVCQHSFLIFFRLCGSRESALSFPHKRGYQSAASLVRVVRGFPPDCPFRTSDAIFPISSEACWRRLSL